MTKRQSQRPLRDTISVGRLLKAIQMLPPDRPLPDPLHWYLTQHEHWIGWLREYHTPGAYGRATSVRRDARYAYDHIVEVAMLVYLAKAAGVPVRRLRSAIRAVSVPRSSPGPCGILA